MKAVGREFLDRSRCQNPQCRDDHMAMVLQPVCHRDAGLDVEYKDGVLNMLCHECKKPVGDVVVGFVDGPRSVAS